jgi:hypothetical protein
MSIDINSRYYYSTIDYIQLVEGGDNDAIVFYEFDTIGTITYTKHVYVEGERLDAIAYKYWGRPNLWWVIPEYNPSVTDFTNLTPGTELIIPTNV